MNSIHKFFFRNHCNPFQKCFLSSTASLKVSQRLNKMKEALKDGPLFEDFVRHVDPKPTTLETYRMILEKIEHVDKNEILVDRFQRKHTYLRISLTERCNLRCQYCMPADGVQLQEQNQLMTSEEILRLVKLFAQAGITKIRLTGGEPLIRKDIIDLSKEISAVNEIQSLGITSNGIVLRSKLGQLKNAGVTHLNVSLDTLQEEKYQYITRRKGLNRVLKSIDESIAIGYNPLKINCVVMRGFNDDEILDFVSLTKDKSIDVRFIEWMPFGSNEWNDAKFISYHEMLQTIQNKWKHITRLKDLPNDTSKGYQIQEFQGTFGFITSMTDHFCGSCNRLRLTADGNLKVCLFGQSEISLRDAMRNGLTDDEIGIIIKAAVSKKHYALGGYKDMYGIANGKNRPMILIGG